MRYAVIIPDGAADLPHPALGNRTPLEAAALPHLHRLAESGRLGQALTVPKGMKPGSDVANLAVLGYDPAEVYTGRAPLEAAALGVSLAEGQAVFRANLVTVTDGVMEDYSAGHISTAEGRELVEQLDRELGISGVKLHAGVSYRHLCVMDDMALMIPDRDAPHDITGQPIAEHNPLEATGTWLLEVERTSAELLPGYAVNRRRAAAGEAQATQLWLWGGGVMPRLRPFRELYGFGGAVISAVDLLKGIARLAELEVVDVPGATGYYDTDYAAKGKAALAALTRHRFVAVHVEAPDEAGHNCHPEEKARALENIDRHIVGPLLAEAERAGDLRLLCMPDHPTPLTVRSHTADPVPFALWGPGIAAAGGKRFTEAEAAAGAPEPLRAEKLLGLLTA